jgi:hypothetical protein
MFIAGDFLHFKERKPLNHAWYTEPCCENLASIISSAAHE